MPPRKSTTLTTAELRLMKILWDLGQGTVNDVVQALPNDDQLLAYKTVLTMLRILEQKGYLRHTKQSRAFVYHPIVSREEANGQVIKDILHRFFDNSPEKLVLRILEDEEIDFSELMQMKDMIRQQKEEVSYKEGTK